jgi:hypothetical protein
VRRVETAKLAPSYENLKLLISYKQIRLPCDPELLSELEAGQNSAVRASAW